MNGKTNTIGHAKKIKLVKLDFKVSQVALNKIGKISQIGLTKSVKAKIVKSFRLRY